MLVNIYVTRGKENLSSHYYYYYLTIHKTKEETIRENTNIIYRENFFKILDIKYKNKIKE